MELARAYKQLIDQIVATAGPAPLLHVHAGLAIYLLARLVLRERRGSLTALHVVFAAEMLNEALDWLAASPSWTIRDTLGDITLTMLWPVAITAVAQHRRRRWRRAATRRPRNAVPAAPYPSS